MKRFLSVGIVWCLFAVGCSKDKDATPPLIGTWLELSYSASGCTNPAENVTTNCSASNCTTLVIDATSISESYFIYAYTIQGDKLILTPAGGTSSLTFTFAVTSTTLTITGQDSPADGNCSNTTEYKRLN